MAVCIFVSVIANVQGTMFMKNLIDLYIMPLIGQSSPDFGPLLGAILKVAVFYMIGVLATFSYNRIMVYVTQGTLKNLRNDMFHHMESLPIKYFDTHAHGDIMSIYTNDIDTLRQMISQSMPQLLSSVITIVSVFVSMIILSIPLTLVSLVMIAIMLFTTKKVAGLSGRYFLAQQKSLGAVNGYIEEMMEGQKVVKVFCHEEESLEKFNQLNDELYDSANNANKYGNILGPVNAQLGNVSYVVCAIAGGIFATYGVGGLTLGALASFLTFNKSYQHADQPGQPAVKRCGYGTGRCRPYLPYRWMKNRNWTKGMLHWLMRKLRMVRYGKHRNIQVTGHGNITTKRIIQRPISRWKVMWYLMVWILDMMRKRWFCMILSSLQNRVRRLHL